MLKFSIHATNILSTFGTPGLVVDTEDAPVNNPKSLSHGTSWAIEMGADIKF